MIAPMTTFFAASQDYVSQQELSYYKERAKGVGTIMTACAYVSKSGKGFEGQMAIDHDATIPGLTELAKVIHDGGAKGIVQLYHGGRLAVQELIPNGATGYLLQQFVSPHSNLRTDEFKNRHLFAQKLIDNVKSVIKKHATKPFLVGYRFSPEEPETPGITMTETFALLDVLMQAELDYLHIATTNAWAKPRRGMVSEKSRTEIIAEYVKGRVPVIGVGSIHTADDAALVLAKGKTDFVALGRAIVVDPHWVEKVQTGEQDSIIHHLTENDQHTAVIPNPLWKLILEVEGWFPVKKAEQLLR